MGSVKLRPLTVDVTCITIASRHKECRTSVCWSRCSEEAKKSLTGNAHVLNFCDDCTLNCVRPCPTYYSNPEQCVFAINRTTVWRASEVQKDLFKLCLFLISPYIYMLITNYPLQHFSANNFLCSVLQTKDSITAKP